MWLISMWCEVMLRRQDPLLVGLVYRTPRATEEHSKKMISMISDAVNRHSSHVLIRGDFNYPGIVGQRRHPLDQPKSRGSSRIINNGFCRQQIKQVGHLFVMHRLQQQKLRNTFVTKWTMTTTTMINIHVDNDDVVHRWWWWSTSMLRMIM